MPISVNMTGVETRPTPLPPGYYRAAVSQCEQKISKTNNPYVLWTFGVPEPEEFVGRKAFFNTSLQSHALWSLKRVLLAFGYEKADLEGQVEFEPSDLIGVECTLSVVEDTWDGETTGKVDQVLAAGSELII